MKIFVFGNDIFPGDSTAVQLIPVLSKHFNKIDFIHADPTENWYKEEKELTILDTVVGIDNVTVFQSLDEFEEQARVTPHDYDVYVDLHLLMKIGKVKKLTIIGIPVKQSKQTIQQVEKIISRM